MKRLVPSLLLLTLASCHRLTGLEGRAGEARHGNGFHVLSLISIWLALFSIVVGGGFVIRGLLVRRGDSDGILWGSALAAIGFVLLIGTYLSTLGLWLCHGTC